MRSAKFVFLILLFAPVLILTGCQRDTATVETPNAIKQVSVEQAKQAIETTDAQLVDVRTVEEYESGHAQEAVNLPIDSLEQNLSKLDKNKPVYLICESGRRSQKGAEILKRNGFTNLSNIEGGTSAWRAAGFPLEK